MDWMEYIQKKGTLNIGVRLEAGIGLLAYMITQAAGIKKPGNGKFQISDFTPHIRPDDEDENGITFHSVARALGVKR